MVTCEGRDVSALAIRLAWSRRCRASILRSELVAREGGPANGSRECAPGDELLVIATPGSHPSRLESRPSYQQLRSILGRQCLGALDAFGLLGRAEHWRRRGPAIDGVADRHEELF